MIRRFTPDHENRLHPDRLKFGTSLSFRSRNSAPVYPFAQWELRVWLGTSGRKPPGHPQHHRHPQISKIPR
jgi:hypothetical protein